uniref:pB1 n=1 Tax=Leuenbergeria bleo TaxID=307721 RepID=A0A2R2JFU8_9CARY
ECKPNGAKCTEISIPPCCSNFCLRYAGQKSGTCANR